MKTGTNAPAPTAGPRQSPGGAAKPKGGDVRFGEQPSGVKGNAKKTK
jgi:hypothetical protein